MTDSDPTAHGHDGAAIDPAGRDRAVYIISVAAELTGVHPQTLRVYERKGLVEPARTGGMSRRYSQADIERIRQIQALTTQGLNLVGVRRAPQTSVLNENRPSGSRLPPSANPRWGKRVGLSPIADWAAT